LYAKPGNGHKTEEVAKKAEGQCAERLFQSWPDQTGGRKNIEGAKIRRRKSRGARQGKGPPRRGPKKKEERGGKRKGASAGGKGEVEGRIIKSKPWGEVLPGFRGDVG